MDSFDSLPRKLHHVTFLRLGPHNPTSIPSTQFVYIHLMFCRTPNVSNFKITLIENRRIFDSIPSEAQFLYIRRMTQDQEMFPVESQTRLEPSQIYNHLPQPADVKSIEDHQSILEVCCP